MQEGFSTTFTVIDKGHRVTSRRACREAASMQSHARKRPTFTKDVCLSSSSSCCRASAVSVSITSQLSCKHSDQEAKGVFRIPFVLYADKHLAHSALTQHRRVISYGASLHKRTDVT